MINNKFFIGVGLDYYWNKKHNQSFLQIIDKLLQLELNDIKSEALIPNFTFSFYNSISSKFFITLNFKTGFGQIITSTSKVICYMSILSLDSSKFYPLPPNSSCYYIENEKISKFDLLDLHLYPELIYFLNSNISLAMEIGGIEYVMYEWKTKNSSWVINLNPLYWKFGIKLRI